MPRILTGTLWVLSNNLLNEGVCFFVPTGIC